MKHPNFRVLEDGDRYDLRNGYLYAAQGFSFSYAAKTVYVWKSLNPCDSPHGLIEMEKTMISVVRDDFDWKVYSLAESKP